MLCCPFYSHLALQRDPEPFKGLIAFQVSSRKKSKSYILDSEVTPARSKKRHLKHASCTIPPQNHSTGLSAPFQLISKSNSSPQRTLQALEF